MRVKERDAMTVQLSRRIPSPVLLRRIEEQRAAIARFREQHGDPDELLRRFMRETFEPDALVATYADYLRDEHAWLERDGVPSDG